ncbi:MAG: chorismate-binding protein, partial [Actinomycetota bacterium]
MKTDRALRARTTKLRGKPDLLDYYDPATGFYFERGNEGIVGVGAAVRIAVPAGPDHVARAARLAAEALSSIDGEAIVTAAIPFDGSAEFELVVPALAIVRRGKRAWMIETGAVGTALPETMPHDPPPEPWDTLRVASEAPPSSYEEAVAEARARISAGELDKVVLARTVVAESDHPFDVPRLLEKLRTVEPDAYRFGVRGFVGATPELLVAREGARVIARPLAGTIARALDPDGSRLLASPKDQAEHRFAAEAVRSTLSSVARLDTPEPAFALSTSKLWHLATWVGGELRAPAPDALTLASILHPTPA